MIIQNRDGSITREHDHRRLYLDQHEGYYAAVPAHLLGEHSSLIERLISFAFDTLGAGRLEVRVYDEAHSLAQCESC